MFLQARLHVRFVKETRTTDAYGETKMRGLKWTYFFELSQSLFATTKTYDKLIFNLNDPISAYNLNSDTK